MVKTRSRSYCKFIVLTNELLLPHEGLIRRSNLGDKIVNSIITSGMGISIDDTFDEMIWDLLGEFRIHG